MAGHCPIQQLNQKVFRTIENAIKTDFKNPYIKGSLKYRQLKDIIGEKNVADYKENPNDEVFTTNRYIGKGFIWGSNRGDFEIHFDSAKKEIINIYLVA